MILVMQQIHDRAMMIMQMFLSVHKKNWVTLPVVKRKVDPFSAEYVVVVIHYYYFGSL